MALIKCPSCGAEISDAALNCPHCGAPRIQTIPTNNSYIPGSMQNHPHAQPFETKSNAFGILSIIFAALYFVFRILVNIYWRWHDFITVYLNIYNEYDQAIITTTRIVTIILMMAFILTWFLSYKKEENQKLRVIGTLIIAIVPILFMLF